PTPSRAAGRPCSPSSRPAGARATRRDNIPKSPEGQPMPYFDLDPLLEAMLDSAPGISDLNLSVGRPPQVEVDGQLRPVKFAGIERLTPYQTELIAMRLLAGKRDVADK